MNINDTKKIDLKSTLVALCIISLLIYGFIHLFFIYPQKEASATKYSEVQLIISKHPDLKSLVKGDYLSNSEYDQLMSEYQNLTYAKNKSMIVSSDTE